MKESLGILGGLIIIGGTLACFAGLGFLVFLWTAHGSDLEGANASTAWRTIMLEERMEQAVTLSTLLIRTAIASQATMCTAMSAALFLENRHVRMAHVAQFSIMRAINDGPISLLRIIMSSKAGILCVEAALVALLVITTITLQFSSTILFSDLRASNLRGFDELISVPNYINHNISVIRLEEYYMEKPANSVFGEVYSNTSYIPDSKGFSDAGLMQRAFLPFLLSQNRTDVLRFRGNTAVMSSKVACMRPNLTGVINIITVSKGDDSARIHTGQLSGVIDYASSLRDSHSDSPLCNPGGCSGLSYACNIPGWESIPTNNASRYLSSFAVAGTVSGNQSTIVRQHSLDGPWRNDSLISLVYLTNMASKEWETTLDGLDLATLPREDDGEWSSFELSPGRFLNISLCFSAFNMSMSYVDMIAEAPLHEQISNISPLDITWDSSGVRRLFGTDPSHPSHADRGILTITDLRQPYDNSSLVVHEDTSAVIQAQMEDTYTLFGYMLYTLTGFVRYETGTATAVTCSQCTSQGIGLHPELNHLIEDTLLATGRAADALRAYATSVALNMYASFLGSLQGTGKAEVAFTKNVQTAHLCRETGCKGLISVVALVACHLLCVFAIAVLFVRQASYSRQGDVWHSVSQLLGDELGEILTRGNNASDSSIKKWMKKEGKDICVKLEKRNGRVQIIRGHSTPQPGKSNRYTRWVPKILRGKASSSTVDDKRD